MNTYRIAFVGHGRGDEGSALEKRIDKIIKNILQTKPHTVFYVGWSGTFDLWVTERVKKVREALGSKNGCIVMIPHRPITYYAFYKLVYDEILYPIEWDGTSEDSIAKRDQWMVDHADLLVSYAESDCDGGVSETLQYARRKGVEIINLAM